MRIPIVLVVFVIAIISACTPGPVLRPTGEALEDAVKIYWDARIKYDPKIAYIYENMSLDKRFDEKFYSKNFYAYKVSVTEFEILEIGKEGSGPKGTTPVKLRLKYEVLLDIGTKMDKNRQQEFIDFWIKHEDNRWYHMIQSLVPGQFE